MPPPKPTCDHELVYRPHWSRGDACHDNTRLDQVAGQLRRHDPSALAIRSELTPALAVSRLATNGFPDLGDLSLHLDYCIEQVYTESGTYPELRHVGSLSP